MALWPKIEKKKTFQMCPVLVCTADFGVYMCVAMDYILSYQTHELGYNFNLANACMRNERVIVMWGKCHLVDRS